MITSILRLLRRYRDLNWAFVDQAMVSGVNFLTGILIARYLGIAEFGRFSLVWLVVLFVNSIQLALVVSPMSSIGPKQEADVELAYYGAVLVQQVVISLVAAWLMFLGIGLSDRFFPEWQVQGLALPLACVIFTVQMQDFLRRYCFCRYWGGMAFANDAISYLGQLGLLIGLAQVTSLDSPKVLWIIAFTSGIAFLFGSLQFRELVWERAIFTEVLRSHWSFAKWLVASAILNRLSGNIFLVTAGALLGTSAVGALKAVQNIMGLTHILFLGMANIVPITAARRYRDGGRRALGDYLLKVAFAGGGVTLAIAMIAAVVPHFWIGLFYGTDYLEYAYLLRWYACLYLLIFLRFPLSTVLSTLEKTGAIFWSNLARSLFALLFAFPLVDSFSLIGVVWGELAAVLIGLIVLTVGVSFAWHNAREVP